MPAIGQPPADGGRYSVFATVRDRADAAEVERIEGVTAEAARGARARAAALGQILVPI